MSLLPPSKITVVLKAYRVSALDRPMLTSLLTSEMGTQQTIQPDLRCSVQTNTIGQSFEPDFRNTLDHCRLSPLSLRHLFTPIWQRVRHESSVHLIVSLRRTITVVGATRIVCMLCWLSGSSSQDESVDVVVKRLRIPPIQVCADTGCDDDDAHQNWCSPCCGVDHVAPDS